MSILTIDDVYHYCAKLRDIRKYRAICSEYLELLAPWYDKELPYYIAHNFSKEEISIERIKYFRPLEEKLIEYFKLEDSKTSDPAFESLDRLKKAMVDADRGDAFVFINSIKALLDFKCTFSRITRTRDGQLLYFFPSIKKAGTLNTFMSHPNAYILFLLNGGEVIGLFDGSSYYKDHIKDYNTLSEALEEEYNLSKEDIYVTGRDLLGSWKPSYFRFLVGEEVIRDCPELVGKMVNPKN